MKILILGGNNEADYIIKLFNNSKNILTVVNSDKKIATDLSESTGVDVLFSDPTKLYTYEDLGIKDYDIVVSLMERDSDNYVACTICKELYGVKKAICTVSNPENVPLLNRLGIDSPISGSFLLAQRISEESDIESLYKTTSLENDKVSIVEFKVRHNSACVGKSVKELELPEIGNICCIYRNPKVIIPRGNTVIRKRDRLVLACAPSDQEQLIAFLKKEKEDGEN